jgi:hypothetical protein
MLRNHVHDIRFVNIGLNLKQKLAMYYIVNEKNEFFYGYTGPENNQHPWFNPNYAGGRSYFNRAEAESKLDLLSQGGWLEDGRVVSTAEADKIQDANDKLSAIKFLKKCFKKNRNVYTVLTHVSSSGMSRRIKVLIPTPEGKISNIGWYINRATGMRIHKNDHSIVMSGAGMDMGFALVYSLSSALYPDGYRLDKTEFDGTDNKSRWRKNGGYRLQQNWL